MGNKLLAVPLFATMVGGGVSLAMLPHQSAPELPVQVTLREFGAPSAQVAVVDGATLRLSDHVVRLYGARPPGRDEVCGATDCATAATNALAAMVGDAGVNCRLTEEDDGRPYGVCRAGAVELNRAVVAAGWARADDASLRSAETEARTRHRGLWAQK